MHIEISDEYKERLAKMKDGRFSLTAKVLFDEFSLPNVSLIHKVQMENFPGSGFSGANVEFAVRISDSSGFFKQDDPIFDHLEALYVSEERMQSLFKKYVAYIKKEYPKLA